ncbi:MAG TPA: sigma 54-interacting transcriptional regulator, partial [Polyangiaceae bacterium]|nr:sigma 54-interacting transcriptional regulator [Polyangiaceae bacterium]
RTISAGRWLLELGSDEQMTSVPLERGKRLVLGAGRAADIVVGDPAVSSRHCELCWGDRGLELSDLGSKNGLYVGCARVSTALLVEDGASFVAGRTTLTLRREPDEPCDGSSSLAVPGLTGASAPMRRVFEQIRRYARSRVSLLLQGESGTGKDVVARALHALSGRSGAYVPLNVAAFPESLADSELFGHRRGAYTGAVASRSGAFEQAHLGTLFLDEIADLAASVQVKLLRVVEDGVVRAIGATQPITVDVRIVSASFAKLAERVEQGRFRVDLFHRLATVSITLPPLRQRRSDIPALSRVLLARMRSDVGDKKLTSAALARLVDYAWPGNVRELGSVLYRAALASSSEDILASQLELPTSERRASTELVLAPEKARSLLERHGGNVSAAARAAHVPRSTFRGWLNR